MANANALLLSLVGLLLASATSGQLVRTVNGSLVMQIAGASLTLSNDGAASNAVAIGMAVEASLGSSIADERNRAMVAEGSLTVNILNERIRAMSAEAGEQSRAFGVEASVGASVSAEVQRAMAAEWNITSAVNAETARAKLEESNEQNRAMNAESSLAQLITRATNADQSLSVGLANEVSRATFATNAEQTRAQNSEGSLATSIGMETTRATNAEGSLTISLNVERSRAISAENALSAALAQSQSQAVSFSSSVSALQAASSSAMSALNAIYNCTQQGLLPGANGVCLTPTSTSTNSNNQAQQCNSGNVSISLLTAQCPPGYSPSSFTSGSCSGTSFSCIAVGCPQFSSGSGVPGGCTCNAGFSGNITPRSTWPYFSGSCTPAACPANSNGGLVNSGCTCISGYSNNITAAVSASGFSGGCFIAPCPPSSTGANVLAGCRCNAGLVGSVSAAVSATGFTSSCGAGPSCAALLAASPGLTNGVYTLSIPSFNGGNPFQVYCDFIIDGGVGYAVVFNRFFAGYQQGPSPAEMGQMAGTAGILNDYRVNPLGLFSAYGATRMIVYATIGQSSAGGITSGTTYRSMRLTGISAANMANCFNGNAGTGFVTTASWLANPSGSTGGAANILGLHGTGGGVFQWTQGSAINTNLLFEYSPSGGADNNHYWSVYEGASTLNTYYRYSPLYGNQDATPGLLFNRTGGVAIF